jgi:hypothetical protein
MRETLLFLEDQAIVHKTESDLQGHHKICKERIFTTCTLNITEFKGKGYSRTDTIIGNKATELIKELVTLNAINLIK